MRGSEEEVGKRGRGKAEEGTEGLGKRGWSLSRVLPCSHQREGEGEREEPRSEGR